LYQILVLSPTFLRLRSTIEIRETRRYIRTFPRIKCETATRGAMEKLGRKGVKIPLQTILVSARTPHRSTSPPSAESSGARRIFAWICKSLFSDRVRSKPKTNLENRAAHRLYMAELIY